MWAQFYIATVVAETLPRIPSIVGRYILPLTDAGSKLCTEDR
jgi:hypothetical protein